MKTTKSRIFIALFFFSFFFMLFTKPSYAWLTGWNYRKPITISNSGSSSLTDYQVPVNISYISSKMVSDFSDLRFTDASDNLLSYWIQSKVDSSWAYVWVKVPSIPASGYATIYVYYGNTTPVTSASNQTAVCPAGGTTTRCWEFYDDFSTDTIASGKWTEANSGGDSYINTTDGMLYQTNLGSGVQRTSIYSTGKTFNVSKGYAYEYRSGYKNDANNWGRGTMFTNDTSATNDDNWAFLVWSGNAPDGSWTGEQHASYRNNANTQIEFSVTTGVDLSVFHTYRIAIHQNNTIYYWVDNVLKASTFMTNTNWHTYTNVYLRIHHVDDDTTTKQLIDWVGVYRFTDPEPTYSIGAEEGLNQLPVITISSPTNTTYFSSNIQANFSVSDDSSTIFYVKVYLDGNVIYDNSSYQNNTQIALNLTNLAEKTYNFTVWANDTDVASPKTSTQTIIFTVSLLSLNVNFSNYTTYSSTKYAISLIINSSIRNSLSDNASLSIFDNSTLIFSQSISPLINTTIVYTYTPNNDRVSNITIKLEGNELTNNITNTNNIFYFLKTVSVETDLNVTFGFSVTQPQSNVSFKVYSPLSPYVNCSFGSLGNATFTPANYSTWETYNMPVQNPVQLGYSCVDLLYNKNESVVEYPIYILKIIPVDEETGVYNTSLWVDYGTNKTALMRFMAVSEIFNQSILWENISDIVWLAIPTSSWIFRFESLYTDNYLANNYMLKDYLVQTTSNELKICVPENKPQNLQTVFSSTPIETSFIVRRAETGCVKEISTATQSIGSYWGFYFYSLPALYTMGKVVNGTETFIAAIRGEAQNLIDLQKILYQFGLVPKYLAGLNVISINKGDNSTIISFASPTSDTYTLRVYKDSSEIYTQHFSTANFSAILTWASLGINSNDVLVANVYNSKNELVASSRFVASGREIIYSAYLTGTLLAFVLILTFLKPLNLEKVFILGLFTLFMVFYFVPKTEPNIYITMLSATAVVLLIGEGVIAWKMVK